MLLNVSGVFFVFFLRDFFRVGRRGGEALPLCSESEGIGFQRVVEMPMIGVTLEQKLHSQYC